MSAKSSSNGSNDPNPTKVLLPPTQIYVTLEEAAARSGMLPDRLLNLVRRKAVAYRGSQKDPLFSLGTIDLLGKVTAGLASSNFTGTGGSERAKTLRGSKFEFNRVITGNVLDVIQQMPSSSVQAVVTSPPFWGQRVYEDETPVKWKDGAEVAYGREAKPEGYVTHTLEIMSALGRVLKPHGTIWWNLGDSYMTRTIARTSSRERILHYAGKRTTWANHPFRRFSSGHEYLKDKDLTMVPFQVAIGAQHLGFWLRSIIVWSKQNAGHPGHEESGSRAHVPEVVGDRPVLGHEYILLFARHEHYDYYPQNTGDLNGDGTAMNVRTVWSFKPVDKGSSHSARFPQQLPRRCIQLATKRSQIVFDPFAGEGNTLLAAKALDRRYFGCDISPTYVRQAMRLLAQNKS